MSQGTRTRRSAAAAGIAFLVVGLSAAPVAARPDAGDGRDEPRSAGYDYTNCALERVGDQYVRCDSLTGAGVPAAPWIPEQTATPS